MNTTPLLRAIAVVELGASIGLLLVPSRVAELLVGQALGAGAPLVVGRVAGAALLALVLACWRETASRRPGPPAALLTGLLAYNVIVALVLVHAFATTGGGGIGLWPTVILHALFAVWIGRCLR